MLTSLRSKVFSKRRQRRQAEPAKRQSSMSLHSDISSNTLYTHVNGLTGLVDGDVSFETFQSINAMFELYEMSDVKFSQALNACDLSDLVVIRPTLR